MSKKKKPQIISIENEFGAEILIPHCPFCGCQPIDPEDGKENFCGHLEFMWLGAVGDYQHVSEDYRQRLARVEDAAVRGLERQLLEECGYQDNLLVMEVTNSGMACGPVSNTDCYGFVMKYDEQ